MPRAQAPNGYYTSTEAQKVLNLSGAMLRIHVQKGRIHYLLPEGRKHGFYLKKDVDKIANEINAFLDIEEKEEASFLLASKDDLPEIVRISNLLFLDRNSQDNVNSTVPNWRYETLEKNPETQFLLKTEKRIIGIATILPFKTNSSKVKEIFSSESVEDANIAKDDIETFHARNHVDIFILNIGIDPSLDIEKKVRRYYGAKLINKLTEKVVELGSRGVVVEKIMAAGATHMGVRILQSSGFYEIPAIPPTKRAFTMNIQESGSHMSMQYKQALAQYEHALEESRKNTQQD